MTAFLQKTFVLLVVCCCHAAYSQRQILGRILDKDTHKPINAAKISFTKADSITSTNILGYFQLATGNTNTIFISRNGYEPVELKVPEVDTFQIHLVKAKEIAETPKHKELITYLQKNLVYPEKARNTQTQATIYALFEIDSLGAVNKVAIHNDIKNRFGKDLVRVLKKCLLPGHLPITAVHLFCL